LWVSDITQHRTGEGWVYLAVVLDAWSRRIVGWSIADHLRAELVVDALQMAIWRRRPAPGTIHHSDHGTQGGFNRSSQHLDREVFDGSASGVDDDVDGAVTDEVAGTSFASSGGRAGVLAGDRHGGHDGGRCGCGWVGIRGWVPVVPAPWRDALDWCRPVIGPLPVLQRA
jgi:hypothetical protein